MADNNNRLREINRISAPLVPPYPIAFININEATTKSKKLRATGDVASMWVLFKIVVCVFINSIINILLSIAVQITGGI
ncbi:hypothetical protein D3C72_2348740 [compost metagenome]